MKLEGGRISSLQLTVLTLGFLFGSSVILAPEAKAQNNAWLTIITGMLEALVFVWVYTTLARRFPDKTVVEINDIIYGPYLGKIVSIFYLWFFLHLASLVTRDYSEFFKLLMSNTPVIIFMIFILLICASAVRNGIEVIARCSIILVLFGVVTLIADTILITNKMDLSNLLPVLNIPINEFLKATHTSASYPFGETIVFIMVIPFLNRPQKARSSIVKAILLAGLIYVMAAIRNIAVLGVIADIATYPSINVVRLIDIADIITRVEIVAAINVLTLGFLYVSVLYYGTVLGTAQLFKMRSYLPLVLPIGTLILSIGLLNYDSYVKNLNFYQEIYPFYSLPFEFLLPLITLLIALIRKLPQEGGGQ